MKKILFLFPFILISFLLKAQTYEDFGFQRDLTIKVIDSSLNYLKNPWGGGLNSCQFSQIDLNQDGIKDLFIYDRSSNKILTFINNGTADSVDYVYAPQYRNAFPADLNNWVELYDYNGDGKEDIFTSANGAGIEIYKNISNSINGLKFTLVTPMLLSKQGHATFDYTNLYLSTNDFPGLADIDNDGDMDVIAKYVLGTYYEYHKNMSMELYGIPDSLDFVEQETCWGKFSEDMSSNKLTLNIDTFNCPNNDSTARLVKSNVLINGAKHWGGTVTALDLDSSGVKDLLLGDTGFPGLIKLTNTGTIYDADMTIEDTMFPSNSKRVFLYSMPLPRFIDVNNDGIKDLIVSPNDGADNVSEDMKSCWYYKNKGTNYKPVFDYVCNNFLQADMIDVGSGAYPVLYDYDGDGLPDLFIGNYGRRDSSYYSYSILNSTYRSKIALYKNIGTATIPEFQFVTNDFAGIASRNISGAVPTFGDINGDGNPEMIIGRADGYIDLYKNTAPVGSPMNMVLDSAQYEGIHVGHPSTQTEPMSVPQLVDLDGDPLLDLVIGQKNGNIFFYKNTGTKTHPKFTLVNDTLGGVIVTKRAISNYGYSVPCFFKDSTNGHFKLFVGSESGYIYYYKNIENNLLHGHHFTLVDSMYLFINEGGRSGIAVANLNNDAYIDMIIGNYSGGVSYFKGIHPSLVGINNYSYNDFFNAELYPNPANKIINIKFTSSVSCENADIRIYNSLGKTVFSENRNTQTFISIDVSAFTEGLYICSISGIDKTNQLPFKSTNKFFVIH